MLKIKADCTRPGKVVDNVELRTGILALRRPFTKFLPKELDEYCPMWRSIAKRYDMTEKVEKFMRIRDVYPTDIHASYARDTVSYSLLQYFGTKVRPFSITKGINCLPKTTSPGLPWNRVGITTKADATKPCIRRLTQLLRRRKISYKDFVPCLAGA